MFSDIGLPWDTALTAADSSEIGYGVCERIAPAVLIADTARCCEAWRYAVEGSVKARQSAFGLDADIELPLEDLQYEVARLCNSDFKEVHPALLRDKEWHVVFSGQWEHSENILRAEGRDRIGLEA